MAVLSAPGRRRVGTKLPATSHTFVRLVLSVGGPPFIFLFSGLQESPVGEWNDVTFDFSEFE